MIRLLLVDDHKVFRETLRLLFARQPDLQVVGEASDARSALRMAGECRADVVLLDVGLPDIGGAEVARHLTHLPDAPKVLALSAVASDEAVEAMLRAGAAGYLLKCCCFEELVQAVRLVVAGQTYVSQSLGHRRADGKTGVSRHEAAFSPATLTGREREVLQLIAQSYSTKEIADRLLLSPKTVSSHRTHILEKLNLTTVAALTRYAVRENLTPQMVPDVLPGPAAPADAAPPPAPSRTPCRKSSNEGVMP